MTMKGKTRIWIAMVLLFISGLAIGFFGAGMLMRNNVSRFVDRGPAHMNERIVMHALRDMDLTDGERAAIDAIIGRTAPELNRISTAFGDSLKSVAEAQFDSIKAVLDDERAGVLEERMETIRERFRRQRDERRGHRPGGRRGRHVGPSPDPPPGG